MNKALSKRHILYVEDNYGDVRLMREALDSGENDYQITIACDGVEALECLYGRGSFAGTAMPELILLDLNLPKKSGAEVLEEIKNDAELRHIPVIVFTSSAAPADILEAYGLHANCYVTKPTDIDELFRTIQLIEYFWFDTVKLPIRKSD